VKPIQLDPVKVLVANHHPQIPELRRLVLAVTQAVSNTIKDARSAPTAPLVADTPGAYLPSPFGATNVIPSVWPTSVPLALCPLIDRRSHTLTKLSSEPEMTRFEEEVSAKATALTSSL
jgi:hypothetical protein